MIPLVDYPTISGIPVRKLLDEETINRIVERTRSRGSDVIRLKGGTVYAPAAVIAVMAEAIIRGRNRVMAASVVPNGAPQKMVTHRGRQDAIRHNEGVRSTHTNNPHR